jgi:hypothetical protein
MGDKTLDPEFIEGEVDRLLAWEWVHGVYCAERHLRPCRLADRLGITTQEAQELVQDAIDMARKAR